METVQPRPHDIVFIEVPRGGWGKCLPHTPHVGTDAREPRRAPALARGVEGGMVMAT
jgi:hypothetical protein